MEQDPDFSKKTAKLDWSVNIPTILTAIGMMGAAIVMYSDGKVERNTMQWQIKTLESEYAEARRDRDDIRATLRQITEAQLQASRAQEKTAQTVEWMTRNPYQQSKP